MGAQLHLLLTPAMDGDWSASRLGRLTSGGRRPRLQYIRVWGGGVGGGGLDILKTRNSRRPLQSL